MKLTELEPEFVGEATPHSHRRVGSLAEAQGILFLCPVCFKQNGGPVGTHGILVWFEARGVPNDCTPTPRWSASGTGFNDLTLSPSIDTSSYIDKKSGQRIEQKCGNVPGWHGHITNGEVT